MKNKSLIILGITLGIIVAVLVIFNLKIQVKPTTKTPVSQPSQAPKLPQGREEYTITQEEGIYPRILKAIVDPLDVHPGDKQKYQVVLADRVEMKKVTAYIEIDTGTTTLELKKVFEGPLTNDDLNQKYRIVKNKLLLNDDKVKYALAGENLKKFIFEGEWTVFGTHSKTYRTKIVAVNANNEKNSITLTWTDPCTPPLGGNWTVDGNCTFSSTNGVDAGSVTGFAGAYTVTLNATFAFNPGYSITINNGGAFAIGTGGQIKQTYLWITDADGDGYAPSNYNTVAQDSQPSGYKRRSQAGLNDCNDADATKWQILTGYTDADGDGYGAGEAQNICSGSSLPPGYSSNNTDCHDGDGSVWWYGYGWDNDRDGYGQSGYGCNNGAYPRDATQGTDCHDGNGSVWWYGYGWDNDRDGYGTSASYGCNNGAYPRDATAGGNDCNDSDATMYPNNPNWYTDAVDHNCSGAIEYYYNYPTGGFCEYYSFGCPITGADGFYGDPGWAGFAPGCGQTQVFYPDTRFCDNNPAYCRSESLQQLCR